METLKDYKDSITISLPNSSPSGRDVHLIDFVATMLENDSTVGEDIRRAIAIYAKERFSSIMRYNTL